MLGSHLQQQQQHLMTVASKQHSMNLPLQQAQKPHVPWLQTLLIVSPKSHLTQ
jgi:hypothetical protein